MTLDSLLVDIGGFGRFQLLCQISLACMLMSASWSVLQMSYCGYAPEWYCDTVDPRHQGDTGLVNSTTTKEACHVNGSWTSYERLTCQDFYYESSALTVVVEWDLVCDKEWIVSAMTSIQMGGLLVGATVNGQLADMLGRRKSLLGSVLFHSAANLVAAFSVSWEMFAVLRFFIGFGIGAILVVQAYAVEFMPIKWRSFRVLIPAWAMGVSVFAGFARLLDNWSHLHIACSAFSLLVFFGCLFLPESMRWLAVQGRIKEAEAVCKKIASFNGKDVPSYAKSVLEKIFLEEQESRQTSRKYSYIDIFKGWATLKITLSFGFFWFSMSFIYYGISFGASSLAGDLYLNIFLLAIVPVPVQIAVYFLMDKIGRKWTTLMLVITSFVAATGSVIAEYLSSGDTKDRTLTGLSLVIQMATAACFEVVIFWVLELYPTVIRNLGFGFSNSSARVAGIIVPFVIDFDDRVAVSYALIGALNLVCIVLCFVNAETNGEVLADVMIKKEKPDHQTKSTKQVDRKDGVFTLDVDQSAGLKEIGNTGTSNDNGVISARL